MAMYKCKNFGSCSRADSGEELSLAAGADDKCPECSSTLVRVGQGFDGVEVGQTNSKRKLITVLSVVTVVVIAAAGFGYKKWSSSQVVTLAPEPVPVAVAAVEPVPVASVPQAVLPPEIVQPEKPTVMVAEETVARKTCDEATKAKQANAVEVCQRASAVTLMNSGVLSAVAGKLDQAEKDYLAAREKDASLPELYYNLAVLKARQDKGLEAVDNLTLAAGKGFTQFSAIKKEPALQKLKSDPALKAKIEALESK
jgi:hypothetical protein